MSAILPYRKKALLILENGEIFSGYAIGAERETYGEIVFNTSMTGYQEILSDPSYAGQIILFTMPHIGNIGVNEEDKESRNISSKGIILRSLSSYYSNWRAEDSLSNYLLRNNIVGIEEVDTRALVITLRNYGSLWGCISSKSLSVEDSLLRIEQHKKGEKHLVENVSSSYKPFTKTITDNYRIVLYDFGVKQSILNQIIELGCDVTILPWNTNFETALSLEPEGIILSNGPGNPNECKEAIQATEVFLSANIPILGICLGHQILGLACDAKVYKMKYGHHGANHPVYNKVEDKVLISSQNHNYAIEEISIEENFDITHYSLFDGSVQGIKHKLKPAIGFQGHPEASPGPHDITSIFLEFIQMMKVRRNIFSQTSLGQKIYA